MNLQLALSVNVNIYFYWNYSGASNKKPCFLFSPWYARYGGGLQTNKNHVAYLAPDRLDSVESLMRSLGPKLLFTDTKSAVLACVIIYMFR